MPSPQPHMFWTLITLNWQVQFQNTIFWHLSSPKWKEESSFTQPRIFYPNLSTFSVLTKWIPGFLYQTPPYQTPSLPITLKESMALFQVIHLRSLLIPEQAPVGGALASGGTIVGFHKVCQWQGVPLAKLGRWGLPHERRDLKGRKPSHDFWSQVSHENNPALLSIILVV